MILERLIRKLCHGSHSPRSASPISFDCRLSPSRPYRPSETLGPSRGGRLSFRRIVFDATHFNEQLELAKTLKVGGCEIVLDPNFAEMAMVGRSVSSSIQRLPWANLHGPWQPEDFDRRRNQDAARAIAEFSVRAGVHAVLAPTHLLEQMNDAWRPIDLRMCEALRFELDQCGGSDIAVDYQLIATSSLLKDSTNRTALLADIEGMPVENVWVRASGFGATATGSGTRQFVESLVDFTRWDDRLSPIWLEGLQL